MSEKEIKMFGRGIVDKKRGQTFKSVLIAKTKCGGNPSWIEEK